MENQVLKALKERRSVRKYKAEQITDAELTAVLEAGTYAATGKGLQDPWIVAVQNEEIKAQLIRMNAEVMGTKGNPYYDAPTLVLVFASAPEQWPNAVQDASLVLGNMMLAAHAVGLGSCWINRELQMFSTDEGRALMRRFGLPDGLIGVGALSGLCRWRTASSETTKGKLLSHREVIAPVKGNHGRFSFSLQPSYNGLRRVQISFSLRAMKALKEEISVLAAGVSI